MTYVDSSVVLRHVLAQDDRLRPESLDECISSALLEVECHRTLDRARLVHGLDEDRMRDTRDMLREVMGTLRLVPLEQQVLLRACAPLPVPLGTLDACHLATALLLRDGGEATLRLATHDRALSQAARAHGFEVVGA